MQNPHFLNLVDSFKSFYICVQMQEDETNIHNSTLHIKLLQSTKMLMFQDKKKKWICYFQHFIMKTWCPDLYDYVKIKISIISHFYNCLLNITLSKSTHTHTHTCAYVRSQKTTFYYNLKVSVLLVDTATTATLFVVPCEAF